MSHIVVVEDESAIAELIAINLRHAGHDVTVAPTAEAARHEIDAMLPDLVVLDWMLPGQSGLALARQWRADARTRELPIILLTARSEESDKVAGLRIDPSTRRISRHVGGRDVDLKMGPTEFRLLHFFMTHPERVHSRAQLLDKVWGDHVFIEERTVDVHVKRLREALTPAQAAGMIETVRGAGYRLTQHAAALQG